MSAAAGSRDWSTVCIGGYAELHSAPDGHAWRGRIEFNGYNRNSFPWTRYITCHEVGHAFGLDHNQTESSSCINSSADQATAHYPTAGDLNTLNYIYGVADSGGDYAGCLAGSDGPCLGPPSSSSSYPVAGSDPRGDAIAVLAIAAVTEYGANGKHAMCENYGGEITTHMDVVTATGLVAAEQTFPCG